MLKSWNLDRNFYYSLQGIYNHIFITTVYCVICIIDWGMILYAKMSRGERIKFFPSKTSFSRKLNLKIDQLYFN